MRSFSIISIPEYQRKKLIKNRLGTQIDYRRFSFPTKEGMMKYINQYFDYYKYIGDSDNSNSAFRNERTINRVQTPRGTMYTVSVCFEWLGKAVPILMFEIYKDDLWMLWSSGRFDFYGAFFHFRSSLEDDLNRLYNEMHDKERSTRVDVAFDFSIEFPEQCINWIHPSKNSDRNIMAWHKQDKLISCSYLTSKNSWYWVRMYNKALAVEQMGKQFWYGWEGNYSNNWFRLEFEFYPPYSPMKDYEIITMCNNRVLKDASPILNLPYRPCNTFLVENAYKFFCKYAKTHWVTIDFLLGEIVKHHKEIWYE